MTMWKNKQVVTKQKSKAKVERECIEETKQKCGRKGQKEEGKSDDNSIFVLFHFSEKHQFLIRFNTLKRYYTRMLE